MPFPNNFDTTTQMFAYGGGSIRMVVVRYDHFEQNGKSFIFGGR
uniref:Uncharacterized protein n=1 Tax=Candidatus Kentrum sp. MB TaxID=2138164 RepID=A0A450XQK3_9GAMM|nr:MAG: hypothetical protein BECKMB1821G_GA0114241_108613 [Candidatus Kentron sp. MB]